MGNTVSEFWWKGSKAARQKAFQVQRRAELSDQTKPANLAGTITLDAKKD